MPDNRLKVCAVSYLNTVPLVWGMLHGRQKGLFDLLFRVPAECADLLAAREVDVGILPCFELLRQDLGTVPGVGIACRGPVRSILLISKCPLGQIRTLAGDSSSRTSVALARILLERRYGAVPRVIPFAPDLTAMLDAADAALVIGDPALRIDPAGLPYEVEGLGRGMGGDDRAAHGIRRVGGAARGAGRGGRARLSGLLRFRPRRTSRKLCAPRRARVASRRNWCAIT